MRIIAGSLLLFVSMELPAQPQHAMLDAISARTHFFGQNLQDADPAFHRSPFDGSRQSTRKNVGLALLYSLAVPGMGELYVGRYDVGKYFTIAEGGLWLTYGSFEWYGTWLRDDARKFAAVHAGVDPSGKDDGFFVEIGNYMSLDEYNQQKLRDRQIDRLYDPNGSYRWQWDSPEHRAMYRNMRISHDRVFNNARFVGAAILVNHIVSAVSAARMAVAHNRGLAAAPSLDVYAVPIGLAGSPDGLMIRISRRF